MIHSPLSIITIWYNVLILKYKENFVAEEKKEPWLNYLALMTVMLAVCATLAIFKGGGSSTRSVLAQSQASDYISPKA